MSIISQSVTLDLYIQAETTANGGANSPPNFKNPPRIVYIFRINPLKL